MMKLAAAIKILVLTISLSTAGLLPAETALAQKSAPTKTFVVIGTATVQGTNVSVAREKAIADSLVTAVALMTEELLEVDAFVSQFTKLNELLFEQTDAFVRGYRVLTEAALGNKYRVIVEATVSRVKIANLLTETGILQVQTMLPSVLLLIAEQKLAEPVAGFWWGSEESDFKSLSAAAMAKRLTEAGFIIISRKDARKQAGIQWTAFGKSALTDQEAAELGSRLKAGVVVTGMSAVTPSTNIMGSAMRSFNGTVSVRVIKTDTVEPLLTLDRTAVAVSEDDNIGSRQALEEVGDVAGQALAEELTAVWQKQASKPSQIEMVIRGTSHLAYYVQFRKSLNSIPGVGGIRVKEIKPNEAVLLVEYKGKTQALAAALMQQTFESFGINIFEVTQDAVRVEIIPG
jgi:hypothetical protein